MTSPARQPKRALGSTSSSFYPSKKICTSPVTASPLSMDLPVSIPFLLQLKEEDVWSLPKSELRKYFLALQSHARNPQDLSEACVPPPASPPSLAPTVLPPFLL